MDTTCMDPATAKIAVQLQLADIDDLLEDLYDDTEIPDGDSLTCFQLMRTDLQQQLQTLESQVLVLKLLKDEHDSRIALSKLLEEERQAIDDHQLAMQLAGVTITDPAMTSSNDYEASLCNEPEYGSDVQWDMVKELYAAALKPEVPPLGPLDEIHDARAGIRKVASRSKILGSTTLTKCVVCMEVVPHKDTLTLACKPDAHTYCRVCLTDLFRSSLINTLLFPPRCCRLPFPLDICRAMLPQDLIKSFDLKVEELATPNPTYCSNVECSQFIRAKDVKAAIGTCVYCKDKTCTLCKGTQHNGLCPNDPHVQLLMDVAKRGRWQQCTRCKNMVELAQGCFHMTCRCTHEFCYLCGAQWKTCRCPLWEEDHLTRPLPIVHALPDQAVIAAPFDPADVAHEHLWRRESTSNGSQCEDCDSAHLHFVMRCRICNLANCWRCIHNRG